MGLTLLQLRTKATQLSGRYDLADPTTFTDSGMDFFISAAQDWLDRHKNIRKSSNRVFSEIAAGTWYFNFTSCRKIEEVWINNTSGRSQLEKKDYIELKNLYTGLISTTDRGTPTYFSPAYLRSTENTDIDNLGAFFNSVLDDSDAYQGIILLPPPDEAIVVEVKGMFYSDVLSAEGGTNFWSNNYPDIFVMAILREIEIFNRNTEGTRDWEGAIDRKLVDIEQDLVAEEGHEITQMEG